MTSFPRSGALCGVAFTGALLLSACGKHEPPPPAPTPAPASTAPVAQAPVSPAASSALAPATAASIAVAASTVPPATPFSVAKLTLGSAVNADHQVIRPGDSFASNDKAIYASVATEGSTGGATLNAKWSYLEGQGQLVSNISQSIATDGPAITTFKVQNPDLWPAGKYQVEISLDGKPVTKQQFQIAAR
ncbi:hypothetical protein [Rhodanobacter spathiphylli]|uniref:Lipoprotein n=1 Tax=Rhodanobacter spathiphylli B39 TaxID=1163407 RepID=I4W7A5_9GAMM|nr:hypothetical protein [Rhodanobacter spathiphylli]EIL95346.1 hypothetical protein UU7_00365 [Rhodanobacter spathiphylli B39]